MYKSLISLILVGVFIGGSSTVPVNNKTKITSTSKKSVSKKNHSLLGSGKSYCQSNGGNWRWNGQVNQWECKGVDISSFYEAKNKHEDSPHRVCIKNGGSWKINSVTNEMECQYRFTRTSQGVIYDRKTKLQWQDNYEDNGGVIKKANWIQAVRYCKNLNLDGKGWRLPALNELRVTTLEKSKYKKGMWWSNTGMSNDDKGAWSFWDKFSSNPTYGILKTSIKDIRCVKGKKALNSHFTRDSELDIVIDKDKKIMWQDNSRDDSATWSNAKKYCYKSRLGGYSNWHLPTMNELISITDMKRRPAIKQIFKGAKILYQSRSLKYPLFYWSSNDSGVGIDFRNGANRSTSTQRDGIVSQSRLYRCVRNMPNNDKIYKDQQYRKKTVIGSKNFKNVKLINGVLWEDQAYNRNRDETYNSCKQYCQNLNLLGVNQWQVPTRKQYNQIRYKGYKKLDNTGKGKSFGMYFTPFQYFTKDECTYYYYGDKHPGAYGIELGSGYNCVRKDSYAADNARGCRCSLDVDIYNQSKNTKLNHLEKKTIVKDFNFYINKFNLTDDVNILKKAEKLAKTKSEKVKVEKAYISFIGDYRKIFKLDTSSIAGKTKRDEDLDILFVKDLSKSKKIRYKIKLSKNSKSPIPLKYGSYKIDVDFTLGLSYTTGYKFGDTTIAQRKSKEYHRTMTFNLNSQNGYSDYQTLDFGKFMVASSGSLSFVGIQSQISSAVLKSKITEVKLK